MQNLTAYTPVEGVALKRLIQAAREEYVSRRAYEETPRGYRTPNSLRIIIINRFEAMSATERLSVLDDLLHRNHEVILVRHQTEVFRDRDAPSSLIADLVCEIVWQALVCDPELRVEDEIREALASAHP
jgi:hypothetical protein